MFDRMKFRNKIILCLCIAMCVVFGVYSFQLSGEARDMSVAQAKAQAKLVGGKYGNEVKLEIEEALNVSQTLIEVIRSMRTNPETMDRDVIDTMMKESIRNGESFYGIQAVFEPNGLDGRDAEHAGKREWWGADGRYGPYFWKANGTFKAEDLTQHSPETNRSWYMEPRDKRSIVLTEPYFAPVAKKYMATICVPLFEAGKFLGIVGVDFTLSSFDEMIQRIKPMGTGRAAIMSTSGYLVAHPNPDLVGKNITEAFSPEDRNKVSNAVKNGEFLQFTAVSPLDGKENMYVFEPITITGTDSPWSILVIIPTETILKDANEFLNFSLIFSVIAILLISLVIFGIVTYLTKPFALLIKATQDVSAGDYNALPEDDRFSSEFLTLHLAMKDMVLKLVQNMRMADDKTQEAETKSREAEVALGQAEEARAQAEVAKREGMLQAASQLEGIVMQISSASDELAAQVDEASRGADVQRERTTEAATAMEQMNVTVLEVAQNAGRAAESADEARVNAESGGEIVEGVVKSIQRVNEEARRLESGLGDLGVQAEGIGNIMSVISDIADQTNLLALNAAIEAARAGEAGRGFAVVADEVRKLAEKTMQATSEVERAVSAIQQGTRENIVGMQGAVKTVGSSTELAEQAGEALGAIVRIVEDTSDQVRTIATAAEEQSAASEQISQNTEEVNRIAGETAESMSQSALAMTELARLSGELSQVIEGLKRV
ncbi:methyl-accepting chemotaxis protein [Halodesulfovibrio sp. MK-HDV]|jgi:methyl-accepting chemotaxis protein|uniref:methyl-accepting chemotaxis protein n=1 Tax=Halodesulfovibrio sp. MK-HDV TaxID=2599925 RepID=UPI001369753C|nr:methyl-accepting chemotaxis protein [Halodesulfovibrio sp. MK-HDV]KAF1075867.1 Methyl-accepting chemotaxis protein PctB [Halodesulfovibrio sp. MK-HDV]